MFALSDERIDAAQLPPAIAGHWPSTPKGRASPVRQGEQGAWSRWSIRPWWTPLPTPTAICRWRHAPWDLASTLYVKLAAIRAREARH
jgi:hypothetical protein